MTTGSRLGRESSTEMKSANLSTRIAANKLVAKSISWARNVGVLEGLDTAERGRGRADILTPLE